MCKVGLNIHAKHGTVPSHRRLHYPHLTPPCNHNSTAPAPLCHSSEYSSTIWIHVEDIPLSKQPSVTKYCLLESDWVLLRGMNGLLRGCLIGRVFQRAAGGWIQSLSGVRGARMVRRVWTCRTETEMFMKEMVAFSYRGASGSIIVCSFKIFMLICKSYN